MEEEAKHLVQVAYSLPPLPLLIFLTATVAMDFFSLFQFAECEESCPCIAVSHFQQVNAPEFK